MSAPTKWHVQLRPQDGAKLLGLVSTGVEVPGLPEEHLQALERIRDALLTARARFANKRLS